MNIFKNLLLLTVLTILVFFSHHLNDDKEIFVTKFVLAPIIGFVLGFFSEYSETIRNVLRGTDGLKPIYPTRRIVLPTIVFAFVIVSCIEGINMTVVVTNLALAMLIYFVFLGTYTVGLEITEAATGIGYDE